MKKHFSKWPQAQKYSSVKHTFSSLFSTNYTESKVINLLIPVVHQPIYPLAHSQQLYIHIHAYMFIPLSNLLLVLLFARSQRFFLYFLPVELLKFHPLASPFSCRLVWTWQRQMQFTWNLNNNTTARHFWALLCNQTFNFNDIKQKKNIFFFFHSIY